MLCFSFHQSALYPSTTLPSATPASRPSRRFGNTAWCRNSCASQPPCCHAIATQSAEATVASQPPSHSRIAAPASASPSTHAVFIA